MILADSFLPRIGGMERYAADLAVGLAQIGHDVEVYTPTPQDASELDLISVHRGRGGFGLFRSLYEADHIVFVGIVGRWIPWLVLFGSKCIVSHHSLYPSEWSLLGLIWKFKLAACCLAKNVAVSRFLQRHLRMAAEVVPNCYAPEIFNDPARIRRPMSYLYVGRLQEGKGVLMLIDAFRLVTEKHRTATLTIVGEGPLSQKFAASPLPPNVHLLGAMPSMGVAEFMKTSAVVVVPSKCGEAFGIVVLEALACGCRVVVTRDGGLPEALGGHGLVCEPDTRSLAQAMIDAGAEDWHQPHPSTLAAYLGEHTRAAMAAKYVALANLR